MSALAIKPTAHVVDVLGNVIGRDQPILRMEKALEMMALLGEELFADENVVFFDPFCKAGELLLACAFHSCWAKSKGKRELLDLEMVRKEVYKSNRYFGLAPDERHHRLSIRTFLGNENSHNEDFNHIIRDGHYVSEEDGKLDKEKFEREFKSMIEYIKSTSKNKRIVSIGNPPYQESDGGFGKSAKSIYGLFTEKLISTAKISEFLLVIPARWFGGGKGLDDFRDLIRNSGQVKNLRYFKNSSDVFPTVDINGGVCFLHFDKAFNGQTTFTDGKHQVSLHLNEFDIIADDPKGYALVRKILSQWKGDFISSVAWSRKPFGLATDHFSKVKPLKQTDKNAIPCLSRNKSINYVDRKTIEKNADKIDLYKVSVPAVAGGSKGNRRSTIPVNQIFLLPKGTVSTETYSVIDAFNSKQEAENLIAYLKTDFARYFLGLRKITQHLPRDRWEWVPYVDTKRIWTDTDLFILFKLTKDEQNHIRAKVKEWSC
nr:Eco57I restriction-modification methylase domain-containing protein [Bdellovibrio sp. CKG001]